MSDVTVTRSSDAPLITIKADGGSRRERGAAIGATIRQLRRDGLTLECYHTSYDEVWGFLPRTEMKYRITNAKES